MAFVNTTGTKGGLPGALHWLVSLTGAKGSEVATLFVNVRAQSGLIFLLQPVRYSRDHTWPLAAIHTLQVFIASLCTVLM